MRYKIMPASPTTAAAIPPTAIPLVAAAPVKIGSELVELVATKPVLATKVAVVVIPDATKVAVVEVEVEVEVVEEELVSAVVVAALVVEVEEDVEAVADSEEAAAVSVLKFGGSVTLFSMAQVSGSSPVGQQ
jgi:hypothetical protein